MGTLAGWIEFEPDHKGLGAMLVGPEFHDLVKDFAEHGMQYAQAISPVDSGEYVNSFEIVTGIVANVTARPGKRAVAELWNTADHAAAVEWDHDHRVLGRTVDEIEAVQL